MAQSKTAQFEVHEHIIPCAYIREYHRATRTQRDDVPLRLAIKQYVPARAEDRPAKDEPGLTIIGGHANGFPKETYEPFWDDLLLALKSKDIKIRGIWVADSSHQGASGVLNEDIQGDEPSWYDYARDLLHMTNVFRDQIRRPIVGLAHSYNCAGLVFLSIMHPRLFTNLILTEPVIMTAPVQGFNGHLMTTLKPDLWESREVAEQTFRKHKIFKAWDPRILENFLKFSLRPVPTPLYPNVYPNGPVKSTAVTLTTPKTQEAWTYNRTNFHPRDVDTAEGRELERYLNSDTIWNSSPAIFQTPGLSLTAAYLPLLRPPVLWLFGAKSYLSPASAIEERVNKTGTGAGGNGGAITGNVKHKIYQDHGHFVIFEDPRRVSGDMAEYLEAELQRYQKAEKFLAEYDPQRSTEDMLNFSQKWREAVKLSSLSLRPIVSRKEKL